MNVKSSTNTLDIPNLIRGEQQCGQMLARSLYSHFSFLASMLFLIQLLDSRRSQ